MLGIKLTAPFILAYVAEFILSSETYIPTQFKDIFPLFLGTLCALLGVFISLRLKLDNSIILAVSIASSLLGTILGFLRFKKEVVDYKRYTRTCNVTVFTDFSPPQRSNRDKFLAAQKACEANVCTSSDCCTDVMNLNHNNTSKIYGSLFERDCLLLLAEKCNTDSYRISYTNKVMQYLETLGDGSPCSDESCAKNQLTISELKMPVDITKTDSEYIKLNQDKIAFVNTLSDSSWATVAGETVTTVDDTGAKVSETIYSGCEYCDTMNLFTQRGPVNQVRYWVKNLMTRTETLSPVCSTCIETVGDLVDCIGTESPDNIFSSDPILRADVKYALSFQDANERVDKRPECFTENAPESCINIRLSKFDQFSRKCIRNGRSSLCI